MGAPDFRHNGRIFATLAYAARGLATLKLTPQQQADFLADLPDHTEPAPGGWGRMGMTLIRLDAPPGRPRGSPSDRPPQRRHTRKSAQPRRKPSASGLRRPPPKMK